MAKIKDKMPDLQNLLSSGQLEKSLRDIAGSDGNMTLSISVSPSSTSTSFSMTGADGSSESYSKTMPYQGSSPD